MKKIIKLTESDLVRIVKKVISEQEETSDIEKAFNNVVDKIKSGDTSIGKINYDDIKEFMTQFGVELVLELSNTKNQDYVRYTRNEDELSDEEFDEAFEKVMSDFKERIVFVYPEIISDIEAEKERQRTDYKSRRRNFNRPKQSIKTRQKEKGETIEDNEIMEIISSVAEQYPKDNYQEMIDWVFDVIIDVESQLSQMNIDQDIIDGVREKFGPDLEQMWMDEIGNIYRD